MHTQVRIHALEALARLKDVDAIAAGPLLDPIDTTRKRAVDLLGSMQADVPLGRIALSDASPDVRMSACSWLVTMRAPKLVLPALNDVSHEVRRVAAEGVEQMVEQINAQSTRDFDLRLQVTGLESRGRVLHAAPISAVGCPPAHATDSHQLAALDHSHLLPPLTQPLHCTRRRMGNL